MPVSTKSTARRRILIVVLGVFAAAVLASVAAVITSAVATPGCEACHSRQAAFLDATRATAHAGAGVSCSDCHVEKGSVTARTKFGVYEVFGMWLPALDPSATDATVAKDANCLVCHEQVLESTVSAGGIAIAHASCAQGRACVDCHSEVGHGTATKWAKSPSMSTCTSCHKNRQASLECATCHLGKVERSGSQDVEFLITHGQNWQKTHGMGQMDTCVACHTATDCTSCHGPGVPHGSNFQEEHSAISKQEGAQCLTCHAKSFCTSCHIVEMPHPKEFVSSHSQIVARDGDGSCMRCHVVSDCDTCHVKHVHPGGAVGNIPKPDRSSR